MREREGGEGTEGAEAYIKRLQEYWGLEGGGERSSNPVLAFTEGFHRVAEGGFCGREQ